MLRDALKDMRAAHSEGGQDFVGEGVRATRVTTIAIDKTTLAPPISLFNFDYSACKCNYACVSLAIYRTVAIGWCYI